MHAVNRILYAYTIVLAILTALLMMASQPGGKTTTAFSIVYYGFQVLILALSIVSLIIGRKTLRAIHRVLPTYYLIKLPMMICVTIVVFVFASNESIFEVTAMLWLGVLILLVGAILQLLVFLEAIWAAIMLIISRNER